MKKILIVGGTFDNNGGKKSSLIEKIFGNREDVVLVNGGSWKELKYTMSVHQSVLNYAIKDFKVIGWFVNIPNDEEKMRDIKSINPHCILIMSKRNNGEYDFKELIKRALDQKANLTIEFSKTHDNVFNMRLFDPLGNVWSDTIDSNLLYQQLQERVDYLLETQRINCKQIYETIESDIVIKKQEINTFLDIVKKSADVFHDLLNPAPTTRFLGNASFNTRCLKGFPSFKVEEQVFVSKRNVDKQSIGIDDFVPVSLYENSKKSLVLYDGSNKPSVDTGVQLNLYKYLPNINYMIHGHVYVENAPFTNEIVPCGDIREVSVIINTLLNELDKPVESIFSFAINLKGHGCIIAANSPEQLKQYKFVARPMPEKY